MKKNVLTMLLVASFATSFSQTYQFNPDNKAVQFERVAEAPGTKDELFKKAKLWVVNTFKSAPAVTQTEDKAEGILVCKGNFDYAMDYVYVDGKGRKQKATTSTAVANADFTIKFFLKEGKYKVVITDLQVPLDEYFYSSREFRMKDKMLWDNIKLAMDTTSTETDPGLRDAELKNGNARLVALNAKVDGMIASIQEYMLRKAENDF